MRILVAADQWFPDTRGGVARVARDTARHLAARGHEVTAIVPGRSGDDAEPDDGVRVVRALRRGALPQTLGDVWHTARVLRTLRGRADVVLAHASTTAAGALLGRIDAPIAYVFHASAPLEARFLHERVPFGKERAAAYALTPVLERLERRSVRGAARLLTLSEFSRRIVADRHPEALARTALVPGAVDTDRFSPGDRRAARARLGVDAGERLVFTVRRLVPRMGLEELVDAAALIGGEPRPRLVVAGTGPLAADLERRARSAAGATIDFVGRVDDGDLVDWYRAADAVAVPTVAYEGFGLVTAEALACGTPVVGTPVGATPELLAPLDPRLLAGAATADGLAAALERTLEEASDSLRERCRAAALERFSWPSAIAIWEEQLELARRA